MTWEIALGIFALVTFIIAITKVVSNNTKAMTEVQCGIKELKESLNASKTDINNLGSKVANHEIRINKLEG